jgi:tetratricopeptide (TPR) repeat protein
MSLHRLPEDGVAALLQALSGQEPPPSLVAAVHTETQGNPFFTEEIFKHLAEEGRLFGDDGRFRPEVAIGELDVPESLRLVLGRRLERLGPDGRRALAAAAVVGRAFTYELLEALGELPSDALLDVLDEAERARLVSPLSDAADEDRLLFSHELIRQTLLAELSQPRRRRLHLRVADTLERLFADSLDGHASEIAHHLVQAGSAADRHRLLRSLTLAGRQAMRTAGYEDALRYFEQALSLIEVADPPERPALFADRALAGRSLGRYEDALPDWEQAFRLYEELGAVEAAARMSSEASFELWWLNRDREALAWAERGLSKLSDRETPQRAEMLGWAGVAGAWVSPFERGAERIDAALAVAERLGEKRLVGYGLVSRALHDFPFALHNAVLEAGQAGADLLRAEGDLWEVATVLGFMEISALELGRTKLSSTIGQEAHSLCTRLGHSFALFVLHGMAVSAHQLATSPDLADYEAFARSHLEAVGSTDFRHMSGTLVSHAAFLRGDWDEALHWAGDAVEHSPERHGSSGMDWAAYLRMLAHAGRRSEVFEVLDRKQSDFPEPGRPNPYGSWYLPAAAIEALSVLGERDRAAAFCPLVTEWIATTGVVLTGFSPALAQRIAGIGAAAARQWDTAEDHFRTALRQAEELPFVIEGAETRRWYAWMLLDRNAAGDRDRARSLVDEAIPVYRRIGMPRHEELARALVSA